MLPDSLHNAVIVKQAVAANMHDGLCAIANQVDLVVERDQPNVATWIAFAANTSA